MRRRLAGLALLSLTALPAPLGARIVSYAPVTAKGAIPAVQSRTARHFLLVELDPVASFSPGGPYWGVTAGQAVLHDSAGIEPPRVLLPSAVRTVFYDAAMWEAPGAAPKILLTTDADLGGDNPQRYVRYLFSADGGTTWSVLPLPGPTMPGTLFWPDTDDVGGPWTGLGPGLLRLGDAEFPFVVSISDFATGGEIDAVSAAGAVKRLVKAPSPANGGSGVLHPIGSDAQGRAFLVLGNLQPGDSSPLLHLYRVDVAGNVATLLDFPQGLPAELSGWLTPAGAAYLRFHGTPAPPFTSTVEVGLVKDGAYVAVARPLPGASTSTGDLVFAVPSADFAEAWIVQRGDGLPTVLSRHASGGALVEEWRDATGPQVEALHAAASGERLLVQVHRPRPQPDQRIFKDPALAVWRVGDPAPRAYDELFLNEEPSKGFVHLDVDAAAEGAPFVFTSGLTIYPYAGGPSGGAGGGDVVQEWGVVRASLRQRLVIPSVARATGLYGAFWTSDLVLRNPSSEPLPLDLRFAASESAVAAERSLTLAPVEIRVVDDVLASLFGLASGAGSLTLTPAPGLSVEATSRTATSSAAGSYGMGVGAVDVFAAAGPRFPLSFAAGLLGPGFRTNLVATDTTGFGGAASLTFFGDAGATERPRLPLEIPAGGPVQRNGLAGWLQLPDYRSGALVFEPERGNAVAAVFVIDNLTNDPTYFPPDLSAGVVRTIPAIVHADGANGARFRSDLFLFNPGETPQEVLLAAKAWSVPEGETLVRLTLLPRESKTIRDVLATAFGKSGVARLRTSSGTPGSALTTNGVHVTSRTYTEAPSGGTFGLLVPPLNAFQSAGPGDALEILGPRGGEGFRTNLALVELTAFADGGTRRARVDVLDEKGLLLDTFEVSVPTAGGMQIDDLFRARGLGAGPAAALLRVTPFGGMLGAYATTIDRGTNDPTYFAASLAAH